MWNNNNDNMMMQNQFMNLNESKIDEIIKPFQEKIKILEDEIRQKDLEIARLKFKLYQKNEINPNQQFFNNNMNQMNNPMNKMNNPMNQMNNPMNQMNNPMNQMNFMNNQINQMMMNQIQMNQMNQNQQESIEFLAIEFIMEDGKKIFVQSKSDDKIENLLNKFYCKTMFENGSYDFFVKKELNNYSTIKENGINRKDNLIFVEKKKLNDTSSKNNNNLNIKNNCQILGERIQLFFNASSGLKVKIIIGKNNTFKDAAITYFNKLGLDISRVGKDFVFLFNGIKLDFDDKRNLGTFIHNLSFITVVDNNNIIGGLKFVNQKFNNF